MLLLSLLITTIALITNLVVQPVRAGCYQRRLCCKGRNMTCVSTEIGRSRFVFNTDNAAKHGVTMATSMTTDNDDNVRVITTNGEADKKNNWHLHVPDLKLMDDDRVDNFTQWLYNSGLDVNLHNGQNADENLSFEPSEFENMKMPADAAVDDQSGFYDLDEESLGYGSGDVGDERREVLLEGGNATKNESSEKIHHVDPLGEFSTNRRRDSVDVLFNGKDKEISYVIVDRNDGSQDFNFGRHRVGLLQHDNDVTATKNCYCDEDCRTLNDCCSDFTKTCPSDDCQVSAWSSWSFCQTGATELAHYRCGPGISRRTRAVVGEPSLGGVPCPHLEEQKGCYDSDGNCGHMMSEVALLLPYKYSSAREPGYKSHIYYDLPKRIAKLNSMSSYCSVFQSFWLDINCRDAEVRRALRPDAKICVECQPAAQKVDNFNNTVERCTGHGILETKTLWTMINAKNCAGQWTLIETVSKCQCHETYAEFPNYIFV